MLTKSPEPSNERLAEVLLKFDKKYELAVCAK